MISIFLRKLLLVFSVGSLVSCGGGGGGGILGLIAGGGISGTGLGTITAFGSVIINDIRIFEIDADTVITLDGEAITEQELIALYLGAVARVDVKNSNDGFTSGTAVAITVGNRIEGPVTGINPLEVLNQTIVLTGDTMFNVDDVPTPGFNPAVIQTGDILEINGFADNTNVIQVSLLGQHTMGVPEWRLSGNVTAAGSGSFNIGNQQVVLNGVVARDCAGPVPAVGELVRLQAVADPLFGTGAAPNNSTLDTVTDVECLVPGLGVPANTTGTVLEAEVEGLITNPAGCTAPQVGDLEVAGQCVDLSTVPAVFEGGAVEDLELGVKLEAEGDLNTSTGVLRADKIKFRENRVRFEGPVIIPAGGVGSSFTLLDVITINTTSLTEDEDGLIDGSGGFTGNIQVEVRGFVDSSGAIFATRIRERGTGDAGDVRLRGPTTDTCDPGAGDTELTILGITVDTDSSNFPVLFQDETVSPPVALAGNVELCALISVGSNVEVEDGVFTSTPPEIDDGEEYSIEN